LMTSSTAPVVRNDWVKTGAHVVAVGACRPTHREMDPDLVARVLHAGNEVGNHTLDHPHLPALSTEAIRGEISQGGDALVEAGAPRPVLFRPPIGLTDKRVAAVSRLRPPSAGCRAVKINGARNLGIARSISSKLRS